DDTPSDVLFYIPVTKTWLVQVVLELVLVCHSSFRGVIVFFRDIFDYKIGLGTIHNIVQNAIVTAQDLQKNEDLSPIKAAANDEIFQGNQPVLAGVCLDSTYAYMLSKEAHRDATTWGVHLLDCKDKGFYPDYTICDGGKGMRAGQREAMPDVPCNGDVFHIEMEIGKISRKLKNKAYRMIKESDKLNKAMLGKKKPSIEALEKAMKKEKEAIECVDDFQIIQQWIQHDLLELNGLSQETRHECYDFIVTELQHLEVNATYDIRPIRVALQKQKADLLGFAIRLDDDLWGIVLEHKQSIDRIREVATLQKMSSKTSLYWEKYATLQSALGISFRAIMKAIAQWRRGFHRASSLVENLNSRLRQYFFLRRQIGGGYLDLLRFYFNHRVYERSQRPERTGRSPAELMTGKKHPHWLEMLGFTRFKKPISH
ncbi:MAG TPA: hypothetical protein ENJ33_01905, partial [Thiothrix sp.]|nr:hypothetical protein [Thiothrix sp.]